MTECSDSFSPSQSLKLPGSIIENRVLFYGNAGEFGNAKCKRVKYRQFLLNLCEIDSFYVYNQNTIDWKEIFVTFQGLDKIELENRYKPEMKGIWYILHQEEV
jgi:hypothetical protein